jgi:hypothetical protein
MRFNVKERQKLTAMLCREYQKAKQPEKSRILDKYIGLTNHQKCGIY